MTEIIREEVLLRHYGELGVYTCDQLEVIGKKLAGRGSEEVYVSHDGVSIRFVLPLADEMIKMESKQCEQQQELRTATRRELDSIVPGLGDFTLGDEED